MELTNNAKFMHCLPVRRNVIVADEVIDLLGCKREDIVLASGKEGIGIEDILAKVIENIPPPKGDPEAPLQAMIFIPYSIHSAESLRTTKF